MINCSGKSPEKKGLQALAFRKSNSSIEAYKMDPQDAKNF